MLYFCSSIADQHHVKSGKSRHFKAFFFRINDSLGGAFDYYIELM